MSRKLVPYFSASGVTAKVAKKLSKAIGAGLYAIEPEIPYTKVDLDWMDKKSRSTKEKLLQAARVQSCWKAKHSKPLLAVLTLQNG